MIGRHALNGAWQIGWSEYQGNNAVPAMGQRYATLPATVPGDVHEDLMKAGVLPDLYVGMNLDHALWVEGKDWWYRREFTLDRVQDSRGALLVFHGLDTFATVWLNGHEVGKTANMFVRHEFPVGALLVDGTNELVVRLAAPMHVTHVDPRHAPTTWSPERLFCRKAQMSFGWDIAPRLVTTGIWRPVELLLPDRARITNVHVVPLAFEGRGARVQVNVEVEGAAEADGTAQLAGHVGDAAWSMGVPLQPGKSTASAEVFIPNAPRWWPVGYGDPALLPVDVRLDSRGRPLDRHASHTGLRELKLAEEPQRDGARGFGFRVNGQDIFVTGLNWTPLDALFARITPERITSTLERLAGVGCNMLRVWGGGIYEPQHFYDECDRLGILVWQDFMMSCGWYPQTDTFAAALDTEARQVVRDLRHHPCLALWCGDNEVDMFYPQLAATNRLTRQVLPAVCGELDPSRRYLPSSPYSPTSANPQDDREGDRHHYRHGSAYRDPENWSIRCRFMSEFGHLSLPSLEVIRRYLPRGSEWPLASAMWKYHGADVTHVKWFRGADCILQALAANGYPQPDDLESAVQLSQQLHAEAVCAWIERYSDDPEFSGFLLWNVADCWPQQSDAVIDYAGVPKTVFRQLGEVFKAMRERRAAAMS